MHFFNLTGRIILILKKIVKLKWLLIILIALAILVGAIVFSKYRQTFYTSDPVFSTNNCRPGYPCTVIENEGKIKVSNTPEVRALAEKYGWEHVHIKALDIDLVRHTAFIEEIYPNLAEDTGCIIIAHAGDKGYVYREDKSLNIAYQETLAEFMERTKDFDSEFMSKFYLSLH
jgi:hypothetical protein